ncbi:unnamed protein product, partial [Gongylonema pulchrum]|uniref:DUF4020 domain-containing protein n=1 Tax=Gongylonema pulchrum TaxID=637853 RepID=A0A183E5F0_9BILA
ETEGINFCDGQNVFRRDRGYQTLTGIDERDELLLSLALQGIVVHELFADPDNKIHDFLHYWLLIASRTDRCLNYTVTQNLVRSSVLLLEARKLPDRAFELLNGELEKAWVKKDVLISRYICEIIRLASAHRDEARRGNWLFKILHKILSLPLSELQEEESGMMITLNSVISAIMEGGSSDAELLVDALFSHPAFRYR